MTQAPEPERAASPAASFDALYAEVAPVLFAWASLRIHRSLRGRLDPQDVVQETWSRALAAFARFDPSTTHFRAWVLTIAKNVVLEAVREWRASDRGASAGPSTRLVRLAACPESVTSFTQRLARDDTLSEFLKRVEALDTDDRHVLVRFGLEQATAAEVAASSGVSADAVAKRWQRLRARLRGEPWVEQLLAPGT